MGLFGSGRKSDAGSEYGRPVQRRINSNGPGIRFGAGSAEASAKGKRVRVGSWVERRNRLLPHGRGDILHALVRVTRGRNRLREQLSRAKTF